MKSKREDTPIDQKSFKNRSKITWRKRLGRTHRSFRTELRPQPSDSDREKGHEDLGFSVLRFQFQWSLLIFSAARRATTTTAAKWRRIDGRVWDLAFTLFLFSLYDIYVYVYIIRSVSEILKCFFFILVILKC